VKFLTVRPEIQLAAFATINAFPAMPVTYDDPMFAEELEFLAGQPARELFASVAERIPGVLTFPGDMVAQEIWNSALTEVLNEGRDVQEALDEAQSLVSVASADPPPRCGWGARNAPPTPPRFHHGQNDRPRAPRLPWSTRLDKFQRRRALYLHQPVLPPVRGLRPVPHRLLAVPLAAGVEPGPGPGTMRYIGLENYVWLMDDPWFWRSITNTLWIAFASGVPQHVLAIPLAFALSRGIRRFRHPLTAAYFLPYITSAVAVSLVFLTIFGTQFGILNQALQYLATPPGAPGCSAAWPTACRSTGSAARPTSSRRSRSW
jgi:ABC-type glycerol-3-phosphate transport system permease component